MVDRPPRPRNTSWDKVAGWYDKLVDKEGHTYHKEVILPGLLRLLGEKKGALLDLGCGQGILGRAVGNLAYTGIDLSPHLIERASALDPAPHHHYLVADVSQPLPISKKDFSLVTLILALQNMEKQEGVIRNAALHLQTGGRLILVLNHPCFRIPRQSGWEIDPKDKQHYRWIKSYLSALTIPIDMHPGQEEKETTWSFHHPLSYYSQLLSTQGFSILTLEEWASHKKSEGRAAKQEDRARREIPLFLTLLCEKRAPSTPA